MSDRLKYKLAIGSNNDFVLNANQENKAKMLIPTMQAEKYEDHKASGA